MSRLCFADARIRRSRIRRITRPTLGEYLTQLIHRLTIPLSYFSVPVSAFEFALFFQRIYDIVCVGFFASHGLFFGNSLLIGGGTSLHRCLFRLYLFIAIGKRGEHPSRNLPFPDDALSLSKRTNTISITKTNELKKNISENRFGWRFRRGVGGTAARGGRSTAGLDKTPGRPFPSRRSWV